MAPGRHAVMRETLAQILFLWHTRFVQTTKTENSMVSEHPLLSVVLIVRAVDIGGQWDPA